uniref:Uncharacterized protein n=1 Tax=Triticum urartu TaxID=4572 RepID=A0A8R7R459_TRIUA
MNKLSTLILVAHSHSKIRQKHRETKSSTSLYAFSLSTVSCLLICIYKRIISLLD